MRIKKTLLLLSAVVALIPSACQAQRDMPALFAKFAGSAPQSVKDWRYTDKDISGAEAPDFDDSGWKIGSANFTWGFSRVGWVRKKITLPRTVSGMDVTGCRAVLLVAADDEGTVYVDGNRVNRFSWDQGYAVLTDDAKPGQTFTVAVRIGNHGGPGRLISAQLILIERDKQTVLSRLIESEGQSLTDWKYISEDVPGAEQPGFDDGAWKSGNPELDYGSVSVAWARKTVTLPDKIDGFPINGARVVLAVFVDDDGEVYVDGKFVQKFHWDEGYVVLTDDAKPGQKFNVAVKMLNKHGAGRLVSAGLRFANSVSADARRLVQDFGMADAMLHSRSWMLGPSYRDSISNCKLSLDWQAAKDGNADLFRNSITKAARELKPFADIADDYTLHLIGHAHIDMNWLWLWPETVEVCQNTFSTLTGFMDRIPDFTFSQSQPSCYLAVQNTKPELFAKIKKYVDEGRWEITGGTWTEGDLNMASGESIVRQILYAKQYFREHFGKEPEICWQPDTFGHPWSIPQIVKKSGLKYYFHMRCGVGKPVYWWQGIDGSRIPVLNMAYSSNVADWLPLHTMESAKSIGTKDYVHVYGVGDHGGGPTRADTENKTALNKRTVTPKIEYSTAGRFFETIFKQKKDYPVHNGELNFEFQGCYTSHGDIKLMNRKSENGLPAAEVFSTIANQSGLKYPMEGFRESWRRTCFNQFHDILCGTAIHGSYDYSKHLFDKTEKQMSEALKGSLKHLAARTDTRGQGLPIVVFNPLSWTRTDLVETACPYSEKDAKFYVVDSSGRKAPAQRIGNGIAFVAKNVPSLGQSTYWIQRGAPAVKAPGARAKSIGKTCVIENEYLRVTVNRSTGTITSIYDKSARREVLKQGKSGNMLQAITEAPVGMSAWIIGEHKKTENLTKARSVEVLQPGPVVASIRVDHWYKTSIFAQDIKLYAGVPRLDITLTADWKEIGTGETGSTMMKTAFAVNVENGKATFEIPFAAIERKADGAEVPAQKWIDVSNDNYGVSLLNDCKYGHDVNGNTMRLTLLRSSYDPDPKPDVGIHTMTYSVYPHSGDWRKAGTVRRAFELNNPLVAHATTVHKGTAPQVSSFATVSPSNLIVTALKKAESGDGMILRFYESAGNPTTARIRINGAKTWQETNLMETGGTPKSIGRDGILLPVGKWEIKTLLLK